jgi:ankyrin repeat protein
MFPTLDDLPRRKPKHHLKLIVVSRNNPFSIERAMQPFRRLHLERDADYQLQNGVSKYIDVRSQELDCPEETRQYVKEKLLANSQGTYLWIGFATNALRKVRVIDMEDTVAELPYGLDAMYRRMIMAISKRKRPRVLALLQWVTAAYRPLSLHELGVAIETKIGRGQSLEEAVIDEVSYAGDMLILSDTIVPRSASSDYPETKSEKTRAVVPVHSSLTDFLADISSDNELLSPYKLDRTGCHQLLHRRALDYVVRTLSSDLSLVFRDMHCDKYPRAQRFDTSLKNNPELQAAQDRPSICYVRDFPLLLYSLEYGLRHLQDAQAQDEEPKFSHALLDPAHPTHCVWLRAQACILTRLHPSIHPKLLHIAALFGLVRLLRHLLGRDPSCVDMKGNHQRTPLFYAAYRSQSEAVAYLIERNANPLLRDAVEQTALRIAVIRSHHDTVNLLIAKGARIDVNGTGQRGHAYSMLRGSNTDLDDDDACDRWIGTPLHLAAGFANPECLHLLLVLSVSSGADIGVLNGRGQTILHVAATRPRDGMDAGDTWTVLKELAKIVRSVDVRQVDTDGRIALHVAADMFAQDHDTVEKIDSDEDSDLEERHLDLLPIMVLTKTFKTPVDVPSAATANSLGGITPLHIACKNGAHSLVDYLLSLGADAHLRDASGRTALHWLCSQKQASLQKRTYIMNTITSLMTLEDIEAQDASGQTASDLAKVSDEEYIRTQREMTEPDGSRPGILENYRGYMWHVAFECPYYAPLSPPIEAGIQIVRSDFTQEELSMVEEAAAEWPDLRRWVKMHYLFHGKSLDKWTLTF